MADVPAPYSPREYRALLCSSWRQQSLQLQVHAGPALGLALQHYASAARDSLQNVGPPESKLRGIPFRVDSEQATATFQQYHSQGLGFFSAHPSAGLEKVKETFLPFWAGSVSAQATIRAADLGFNTFVPAFNPQTKRMENTYQTVWRRVRLNLQWDRAYGPDLPGMQIYASYKYPRSEIHAIRPGPAVDLAQGFDERMLTSGVDGSTRRVGPFHMKPQVALRFAKDWIKRQEQESASSYIRSTYNCDAVRFIDMDIRFAAIGMFPLYLPAYVFRSRHFGRKLRTFVSGVAPGISAGARVLDESKVALAAGAAAGVAVIFTQAYQVYAAATIWVWGIALPMTAAGVLAHYFPYLRSEWLRFRSTSEESSQRAENQQAAWDAEWVRAYSQYEESQRARDERENAQYSRQQASYQSASASASGRAGDPRGYYATLGVASTATKQEIQAAFRGLALKLHPDMHHSKAGKEKAEHDFQQLNEAYAVLRDPAKRRQYDGS